MSGGRVQRVLVRRQAGLAVGALALAFAATLVLPPWSDESVGDLEVRSSFAALLLDGELPYRDFRFEYPPLAAPAIALPGIVGTEDGAYRAGIAAFGFLLAVCVLLLVGVLARQAGGRPGAAMLAVAAAPLLLGAVVRLHIDLLPVALTLAALAAVLARRPAAGLALVGLGAMTKGFPIVVAPVALAWLWGAGDRRGAIRGAVALAATLAVLAAGWIALSPEGALESLDYQLDRPAQLESSPASALFAAGALGAGDPSVVESHRSAGLAHPLAGPVTAAFAGGLALAVALLSAGAALGARRGRAAAPVARSTRAAAPDGAPPPSDPAIARPLVLAGLAALAAFAAFGKVLSPQYLMWVVPLLALALAWRMRLLAAACAAACALTLVEFPSLYLDLVARDGPAIWITAARNAALLAVVALAGAELWRLVAARTARTRPPALTPAAGAPARSIVPTPPAPRR